MKIVAIVQARMGSTRLPKKVLIDIAGKTMLERTIERIQRCTEITEVMVATTDQYADDVIVAECDHMGIQCFRGSEEDVLDRYTQAALSVQADIIVRFTADCPLIDAEIISVVLSKFLEEKPDYASTVLKRTYPRGLDTEVLSMNALQRVWEEAKQKHEREHVTPYILENPEKFSVLSVEGEADYSSHRWTVDTPEDLALVQAIYEALGEDGTFGWKDIIDLIENNPEIHQLNANIEQKSLKD